MWECSEDIFFLRIFCRRNCWAGYIRRSFLSKINSFTCRYSIFITPPHSNFLRDSEYENAARLFLPPPTHMPCVVETAERGWKTIFSFQNQSTVKAPLFPTFTSTLDMYTRCLNSNSGNIYENYSFIHCQILRHTNIFIIFFCNPMVFLVVC